MSGSSDSSMAVDRSEMWRCRCFWKVFSEISSVASVLMVFSQCLTQKSWRTGWLCNRLVKEHLVLSNTSNQWQFRLVRLVDHVAWMNTRTLPLVGLLAVTYWNIRISLCWRMELNKYRATLFCSNFLADGQTLFLLTNYFLGSLMSFLFLAWLSISIVRLYYFKLRNRWFCSILHLG